MKSNAEKAATDDAIDMVTGSGIRKKRLVKGSQEAKDFMRSLRERRKVKGGGMNAIGTGMNPIGYVGRGMTPIGM